MELLPQDVILHMAIFIKRVYIHSDYYLDRHLVKENGEGHYYPIQALYATSKAFHWLSKLEYICIETGQYYSDIVLRNINGLRSMLFNVDHGNIVGYKNYNNHTENYSYTDSHYDYRDINGIEYCDGHGRHGGKTCRTCDDLHKIQQVVFDQDPQLKSIIDRYDNGVVIIRDKVNREYVFNNYCTDYLTIRHK